MGLRDYQGDLHVSQLKMRFPFCKQRGPQKREPASYSVELTCSQAKTGMGQTSALRVTLPTAVQPPCWQELCAFDGDRGF